MRSVLHQTGPTEQTNQLLTAGKQNKQGYLLGFFLVSFETSDVCAFASQCDKRKSDGFVAETTRFNGGQGRDSLETGQLQSRLSCNGTMAHTACDEERRVSIESRRGTRGAKAYAPFGAGRETGHQKPAVAAKRKGKAIDIEAELRPKPCIEGRKRKKKRRTKKKKKRKGRERKRGKASNK